MDEEIRVPYLVTCRTEICDNSDLPIEMLASESPLFVCGPCGQIVVDVVAA